VVLTVKDLPDHPIPIHPNPGYPPGVRAYRTTIIARNSSMILILKRKIRMSNSHYSWHNVRERVAGGILE